MLKEIFVSLVSLTLIVMLAAPVAVAQDRRRIGSKGRAIMTAGTGAAIGAGIGALVGGKKGAGIGALLGGGGATAGWLMKNEHSRRRLGKYGRPIATIGAGTALGAGVGALVGGKKGAGIGALLGGGGTTAGYLISNRNRRSYDSPRYYPGYNSRYRGYRRTSRTRYYCN